MKNPTKIDILIWEQQNTIQSFHAGAGRAGVCIYAESLNGVQSRSSEVRKQVKDVEHIHPTNPTQSPNPVLQSILSSPVVANLRWSRGGKAVREKV